MRFSCLKSEPHMALKQIVFLPILTLKKKRLVRPKAML